MTPINVTDYVQISRLINRYADAVVHRDGAQWTSCWAVDATWDLGRGRNVVGREAIAQLWYGAMGGFAATVQVVHNGEVWEGDGADHASGRWYISEAYCRADDTRGILLAHYDDSYVRVAGEWLFASRRLQPHYMGPQDLSAEFTNTRAKLTELGLPADV